MRTLRFRLVVLKGYFLPLGKWLILHD